jgi:hypothetical protein
MRPNVYVSPAGVLYIVDSWNDRVLKIVSFFLFRYRSGRLEDHDDEVEDALWIPLEEAPARLAYRGEKDIAKTALSRLAKGK